MADVQKVSGFKAIDQSFHATKKAAMDYSRDLKVKEALAPFGQVNETTAKFFCEIDKIDADGMAMPLENMPKFLQENREAILKALNQDVQMRAPRKPRATKPVKVAGTTASAPTTVQ